MAYVHQVSFDIPKKDMDELQIGSALQRVLGYLRSRLPSEPGYMTARAFYSVDKEDVVHIVFQSQWMTWHDLQAHGESRLSEEKVLQEFGPVSDVKNTATQIMAEVD
jgi:hypothetical protein